MQFMFDNPRQILFCVYILFLTYTSLITFSNNSKAESFKRFYWIIASPLIVYSIFRPFPLMRDDPGYFNFWVRENFDFVFYQLKIFTDPLYHLILYIFKKIYDDIQIVLFISGISLFIKLWVISHFPPKVLFLSLLTYTCLYYQLHDLTQLRASVASMFFLLALHFLYYEKIKLHKTSLILSILSHTSTLPNLFLIFFYKYFSKKRIIYFTFIIIIILSWLNLYPGLQDFDKFLIKIESDLHSINPFLINTGGIVHKVRSYVALGHYGVYNTGFNPPLIFLILAACYSIVLFEIDINKPVNRFIIASFFIATFIGFFFNSIQDIQVRLYEFYFIAGLFLIRQAKTKLSLICILFLSLMYFIKFNIKWQIGI